MNTRHRAGACALTIALCCAGGSAWSTDFGSMVVGQPLVDKAATVGHFTVRLPEGNWVVASKGTRTGTAGGGGGRPAVLSVFLASIDAGRLRSIVLITSPSSTFGDIRNWSDDPCQGEDFIIRDASKASYGFPDCFSVRKADGRQIVPSSTPYIADGGKWLVSNQIQIPEQQYRVHNSKYRGGDFLLLNTYLPVPPGGDTPAKELPVIEAWGRAAAEAVRSVVTRDSKEAVLMKLPLD